MVLTHLLVVSDLDRARQFYRDVLGATVYREYGGTSRVLTFQGSIGQIERARAAALLERGVSILDTMDQAGYVDQPHLTKALKRLIGQTPGQTLRSSRVE